PPEAFMQCPQGTRGEYVIKAGDSLSTVAEANGLTTSGLLIANPHLRPANFLIIGTRVCIP
ncbi:MAG TPA: LysM domain-containing protein, partial [Sedimentibacter sp.]|nr:LysM domain-containing protein [Sedimentibacter sp.]